MRRKTYTDNETANSIDAFEKAPLKYKAMVLADYQTSHSNAGFYTKGSNNITDGLYYAAQKGDNSIEKLVIQNLKIHKYETGQAYFELCTVPERKTFLAISNFIKSCKNLKEITFSNTILKSYHIEIMASAIGECKMLEYISFNSCSLDDIGLANVVKAVAVSGNIKELDLVGNRITDAGAIVLTKILEEHQTLAFLRLNRNAISDEGAKALAKLIKLNSKLSFLSLDNNQIGDAGTESLTEACKSSNFKGLNLKENYITEKGENLLEMSRIPESSFKPQLEASMIEKVLKFSQPDKPEAVEQITPDSKAFEELKAKFAQMEEKLLEAKQQVLNLTQEKAALDEQLKAYQAQPTDNDLQDVINWFEEKINISVVEDNSLMGSDSSAEDN